MQKYFVRQVFIGSVVVYRFVKASLQGEDLYSFTITMTQLQSGIDEFCADIHTQGSQQKQRSVVCIIRHRAGVYRMLWSPFAWWCAVVYGIISSWVQCSVYPTTLLWLSTPFQVSCFYTVHLVTIWYEKDNASLTSHVPFLSLIPYLSKHLSMYLHWQGGRASSIYQYHITCWPPLQLSTAAHVKQARCSISSNNRDLV